jgi:hypothetical protein
MADIEWWVYLAALGGLAVVSLLLHVLVVSVATGDTSAKRHGIAALFLGADNRTSTSKLQAMLWTYAVLWALISLLAGAGIEEFSEALGDHLREEYFLLLGGPFAAAIAAKAITTQRVSRDPNAKTIEDTEAPSTTDRFVEVVSNDEGAVDLGDFQYSAFTLLTLTYFAWAFIDSPGDGLPAIPGTLLVLVAISQGAYVGKKALLPDTPPENQTGEPEPREEP